MTTTPSHAYLQPSSAATWIECPGQPAMVAATPPLPEDDTPSREGTAAHWAGAEMLAGQMVAEGQITDDGTVLTQEMIDSAEVWVQVCQRVLARSTTRATPMTHGVESRQKPTIIHPQNWGTVDFWHYDANARVLYVIDFKHGHGIVEVFENWQLINYAALLLPWLVAPNTEVRVELTIVQPRAFHRDGPVRTWSTTSKALEVYWHRLTMAADDATSGTARTRANSGCTYCPARHACPTLQADAYRSAHLSGGIVPLHMSPVAVGLELTLLTEAADRLKARITGLTAQGEAMTRAGQQVPGWAMEDIQAREAWHDPKRAAGMARALGLDIVKDLQLVTPRQARDKGMPEPLVAALSGRPPGGRRFARADESLGRRVFGVDGGRG